MVPGSSGRQSYANAQELRHYVNYTLGRFLFVNSDDKQRIYLNDFQSLIWIGRGAFTKEQFSAMNF